MLCVVVSTLSPPRKISAFTIYKKNEIRKNLQIKLRKALKFCDYTIDDNLSEACEVLWKEVDTLSYNIIQYKELELKQEVDTLSYGIMQYKELELELELEELEQQELEQQQ